MAGLVELRSRAYSLKSLTRSGTGRLGGLTRWILRKPPSSPMAREHLLLAGCRSLLLRRLIGAGSSRGITGPRPRVCRVLVLPRLADIVGLLATLARRHVRRRLAG